MTNEKYRQTERLLYDYKFIKGYVELRKQDLKDLEYEGVKALQFSDPAIKTSGISDPVAREFELLEKQRAFLKQVISEKERILNRIDYALSILNDTESKIIEMKYPKLSAITILRTVWGIAESKLRGSTKTQSSTLGPFFGLNEHVAFMSLKCPKGCAIL